MYSLLVYRPRSLPFCLLRNSSTPSSSDATAAVYLVPTRLMSACYHHCIPTRSPGVRFVPSHRFIIDRIEMYCATVFCLRQIHSFIIWKIASYLATAAEVYSHLPSVFRRGSCLVRRRLTCSWNPPQDPAHVGGDHPCLCAK